MVGHSSGALAALGLLQAEPTRTVARCVLVGAFQDDLGWPALRHLFRRPFDFTTLRARSDHYLLVHSDSDPYCPLSHAEDLAERLDGELVVLPGQGHFSADTEPPYFQFPWLLDRLVRGAA